MFKVKMSELNTKISKAILLNVSLNGEDYYKDKIRDLTEKDTFYPGSELNIFPEACSFLGDRCKLTVEKSIYKGFLEDPNGILSETYEFNIDTSLLLASDIINEPLLYIRKNRDGYRNLIIKSLHVGENLEIMEIENAYIVFMTKLTYEVNLYIQFYRC